MNKAILIGRLTKDPETRYTQGANAMAISRFTLAVDRKIKKENEPTADFLTCVAFGKQGEFSEKYLRKGTKIALTGHIQTGSYTNKDGAKVYTTDIIVDELEFAESKTQASDTPVANTKQESFMDLPDGIDEELPFN